MLVAPTMSPPVSPQAAPRPARSAAGFSLIQLLTVIALLGTLITMAIPGYRQFVERARQSATIASLGEIDIAINEYSLANAAQLPADLAEIDFGGPLDAWGGAIVYVNLSLGGSPRIGGNGDPVNSAYDLYSAGSDGETALSLAAAASQDDVVLAADGGFVGLASQYLLIE